MVPQNTLNSLFIAQNQDLTANANHVALLSSNMHLFIPDRPLSELLRQRKRQPREEPAAARKLAATPATWEQMVKAVEKLKGESWEQFSERHGDWGRDAVLWLGRFCYYHLVPGLLLR